MIDYSQYDIFLITKDNWKEQSDLLFGYKTFGDNGFWLKVTNKDNKLTIKGSYIQPVIAVYKNENFWAISNSVYVLEDYLKSNNYALTVIPGYDILEDKFKATDGYAPDSYSETKTKWKEIQFTPNFSYIEIKDDILSIIETENTLFKNKLENSKDIILNWFKNYYFYLFRKNLNKSRLIVQVSGGMDSRFLINFWKNLDIKRIVNNWNKDDYNDTYLDGIIGRLAICYYTDKKDLINAVLKLKDCVVEDITEEDSKLFVYGISFNRRESESKKYYLSTDPSWVRYYLVSGVGTEWCKGPTANNQDFVLGTIRRYFCPKFIGQYYIRKNLTILPFIDSSLLTIKGFNDRTFMLVLYLIFSADMLETPFFTDGQLYQPSEEELNKAKKIIEGWN